MSSSSFRDLVNLESLYIYCKNKSHTDLLDLSQLVNLKRLNMDSSWHLKELKTVTPTLTHLKLKYTQESFEEKQFIEVIRRFTNLEYLNFYAIKIEKFDVNWLSHDVSSTTTSLKFLRLHVCGVQKVNLVANNGENCRLENLEELDLSHNELNEFSPKAALCVPNLKYLNLSQNCLQTIHRDMFRPLMHLTWLDLSLNKIESIEDNVFADLVSLESLSLGHNQLVHQVSESTFAGLGRLENLCLRHTGLTTLTPTTFKHCVNLKKLDICQNPFDIFADASIFINCTSLKRVILNGQVAMRQHVLEEIYHSRIKFSFIL